MAENKKSFVLYCDLIHTVKKLPKEKAGELFIHILKYVNDENPETDDLLIQISFEPIKQQLKRDLRHWEHICLKRSESGKLGGRPKKQIKAKKANGLLKKQTKAKKPDNDNVNDNDIINNNYNFYVSEATNAKTYTDKMSQSYVNMCRHLLEKNIDGSYRLIQALKMKVPISLNDFSKLYQKSGNNLELINSKIDSIQTNKDYHDKYTDLYLLVNKWLNNK